MLLKRAYTILHQPQNVFLIAAIQAYPVLFHLLGKIPPQKLFNLKLHSHIPVLDRHMGIIINIQRRLSDHRLTLGLDPPEIIIRHIQIHMHLNFVRHKRLKINIRHLNIKVIFQHRQQIFAKQPIVLLIQVKGLRRIIPPGMERLSGFKNRQRILAILRTALIDGVILHNICIMISYISLHRRHRKVCALIILIGDFKLQPGIFILHLKII